MWVQPVEKSGKTWKSQSPYLETVHLVRKQRGPVVVSSTRWGKNRQWRQTDSHHTGSIIPSIQRKRRHKNYKGKNIPRQQEADLKPLTFIMGRRDCCWTMLGQMGKSNAKHDSLKAKVQARWTSAEMGAITSISGFSSVKRENCHEQMEWSWTSQAKKNLRTCRAQILSSKLSKSQLKSLPSLFRAEDIKHMKSLDFKQ